MSGRVLLLAAAIAALAACEARFDPETGRRYPCDPEMNDPSECPGGFKCGLEGFCRDPNAPGAWLCKETSDCPSIEGQLWHCGFPNGFDDPKRCYDRATAVDIACRYGAEVDDCAPEWKCGVNGRCHDQTPRAYACVSDDDCEGGWRCGLEGVCHDTTREALQPLAKGPVLVERLSPQLPDRPTDFALQHPLGFFGSFLYGDEEYLAAYDGGLAYVEFDADGRRGEDGGWYFAERRDVAVLPTPTAVALDYALGQPSRSPLAVAGEVLEDYSEVIADALGRTLEVAKIPVGSQLRLMDGSPDEVRVNFAFSGASFSIYSPEHGWASNLLTLPDAGVPYAIRDIIGVLPDEGCDDCGEGAAFSTDVGLFFASRGEAWTDEAGAKKALPVARPVTHPLLPNAACTPGQGAKLGRMRLQTTSEFGYPARFAIAAERFEEDGGVSVVVAELGTSAPLPTERCSDMGIVRATSCPACPGGGTLVELALDTEEVELDDAGVEFFEPIVRCAIAEGDGGVVRGLWSNVRGPELDADGGCAFTPIEGTLTGALDLRGSPTRPEDFDSVDRAGGPWACRTSWDLDRCYPLLMPYQPEAVIGDPEDGWFMGFSYGDDGDGGTYAEGWRLERGVGMAFMDRDEWFCVPDSAVVGSVRGRPDWLIHYELERGNVELRPASTLQADIFSGECAEQLGPAIARLQNAATVDFTSPDRVRTFAAAALTPDGGSALVIAAGDRVWATEVTETFGAPDAGTQSIAVRAVPLPFTNISSLAVLAPGEDTSWLSGYVITNQRLFRLSAQNPEVFDTREVAVEGTPIAVFADGHRGRVGTRGGDVFSLPIPVPIAHGPLAADDPEAQDFGSACGDTFALGQHGLYRLEPREDSPVGQWVRVDTSTAFPDDPVLGSLEDGRFHQTGEGLFIVTARGLVYRVGYERCDEAP